MAASHNFFPQRKNVRPHTSSYLFRAYNRPSDLLSDITEILFLSAPNGGSANYLNELMG